MNQFAVLEEEREEDLPVEAMGEPESRGDHGNSPQANGSVILNPRLLRPRSWSLPADFRTNPPPYPAEWNSRWNQTNV